MNEEKRKGDQHERRGKMKKKEWNAIYESEREIERSTIMIDQRNASLSINLITTICFQKFSDISFIQALISIKY